MNTLKRPNENYIYPVGTQIVTHVEMREGTRILHPAGAVGVIVAAPVDLKHSYRVRFPDGIELPVKCRDLVMLSKWQQEQMHDANSQFNDLFQFVSLRAIVGSRAFGLETSESDVDYRGFYLAPTDLLWSLAGVPEQLERESTQEAYWELKKFFLLALKANPNVLECLYSPLIELATPLAEQIVAERSIFLSRLMYQTYNGYVMSQFKKMQADIRNRGEVKWKHVMHLLRLLMSGIHVFRFQEVAVNVGNEREFLLDVRNGEVPWEQTEKRRLELHAEFENAFKTTKLPERPDYARANAILIEARRSAI